MKQAIKKLAEFYLLADTYTRSTFHELVAALGDLEDSGKLVLSMSLAEADHLISQGVYPHYLGIDYLGKRASDALYLWEIMIADDVEEAE